MGRVVSDYESDHTRFMRELLGKNPQWTEEQRSGRALWWDKAQETEAARRTHESRESHKPYPYDVNF